MLLVGTRPEALKLAPVARAFRDRGHPFRIVATGQHPLLAASVLLDEGLVPHADLGVCRPGQGLAELVAAILQRLAALFACEQPGLLLVQGDTATCLAGALAAFYAGVPVGHVEAGLRTGDLAEPFPEEAHRALVARLAALHFAPTPHAARRLVAEGIAPETIHVVGNTSIDALHRAIARLRQPDLVAAMESRFPFARDRGPPLILVTIHRRENQGHRLRAIAAGLTEIAEAGMARILMPLHPNPAASHPLKAALGRLANVRLLPPLGHSELLWLMERSDLVLTDSGGIQEEAPALGVRTLVVREATERVEGIEAGVAELVAPAADAIVSAVRSALALPPLAPTFPYGDGQAAGRIADVVEAWLGAPAPAARLRNAIPSRQGPA